LKWVAADARQIETAASQMERLAKDPNAAWAQYDRQWNEMQPFVERMNINIARLERMESSLTATEKKALEDSKAESQRIAWQSAELGKLVDQVPANLTAPQFKNASRAMVNEASKVADAAKNGA